MLTVTPCVAQLSKVIIFSDGCAAQYKSKLPFFFLSNREFPVAVEWHFFGSRHGKSLCDACGGVMKSLAHEDVLASEVIIQNAEQMYNHCMRHYQLPEKDEDHPHKGRGFHLFHETDTDRSVKSSDLKTVAGTRMVQCVRGCGKNRIETKRLSCFCESCTGSSDISCINQEFAGQWCVKEIVKLKRVTRESDQELEEEEDEVVESRTA